MRGPNLRWFRWLAVIVILGVLIAPYPLYFEGVGHFLVRTDPPAKADIVVVLAGDEYGNRILKGAELVREGYAPAVLVSGPWPDYGRSEADYAIAFAERRGYPAQWFIPIVHSARSTREEAQAILPELRRRGVRRYLLVTSNYHTRRAGAIFRRLGSGLDVRVVAARDECFTPDGWWHNREGRKIAALEIAKTFANWLGGL